MSCLDLGLGLGPAGLDLGLADLDLGLDPADLDLGLHPHQAVHHALICGFERTINLLALLETLGILFHALSKPFIVPELLLQTV